VARIVPMQDAAPGAQAASRRAALRALQAFEPIAMDGASLAELIAAGRA